jgi:transcriptional regulator with XRE-family HTH domain
MEQGTRPIPNRLLLHRRLRSYKQKEVAQLLGLYNVLPLRQWEQGKTLPATLNLIKLSILYRTYPNELYPEYFKQVKSSLDATEFALFEKDNS